eukprot:TRINITY_DN73_c0_g1_i1.p1 TRINITY_DN73_c0_g1~~TRINITY_DN73_c0_g1_i1.p1  ORF type:complete len:516 (+),score=216.70 TRINITY_DN73_c0_g1_i1:146-1693(+)
MSNEGSWWDRSFSGRRKYIYENHRQAVSFTIDSTYTNCSGIEINLKLLSLGGGAQAKIFGEKQQQQSLTTTTTQDDNSDLNQRKLSISFFSCSQLALYLTCDCLGIPNLNNKIDYDFIYTYDNYLSIFSASFNDLNLSPGKYWLVLELNCSYCERFEWDSDFGMPNNSAAIVFNEFLEQINDTTWQITNKEGAISMSINCTFVPSPSLSPTNSATASRTRSRTSSRSLSNTPTSSPSPSNTNSVTASRTRSRTSSPSPSNTPTSSRSLSNTPTSSRSPSNTRTLSISPTLTPTISLTSTVTPTSSITESATKSISTTSSATPTSSITESATRSATRTKSLSTTRTNSISVTPTISTSNSRTPSSSPTRSSTSTPSSSPSRTPSSSPTATRTVSISLSSSQTPTTSITPSVTPTASLIYKPPGPVRNLRLVSGTLTSTSFSVTWLAPNNFPNALYEVQLRNLNTQNLIVFKTNYISTSYTFNSLTKNTKYRVFISAINPNNNLKGSATLLDITTLN